MRKTIWDITDNTEKIKLSWYHFGKAPQFPKWFLEENHIYIIKMVCNDKLPWRLNIFMRCLTHTYTIN